MPSSEVAAGIALVVHRATRHGADGQPLFPPVSFEVKPGEHVAIVGASGAGKSLILRMLAGAELPTQGSILVDGAPTRTWDYHRLLAHRVQTGYVFANHGLLVNTTIEENVALPLRYHRGRELDEDEVRARVRAVLAELGIETAARLMPALAAPSARKLALFARALVLEPRLLLCETPQVGLPRPQQEVVRTVCERRRSERRLTIVQTDHDASFGPFAPDRVVELGAAVSHENRSLGEVEG